MFKYTVTFKLIGHARKSEMVIKSAADLDLEIDEHMDYFAAEHEVLAKIEKIFGKDKCVSWMVTNKVRIQETVAA